MGAREREIVPACETCGTRQIICWSSFRSIHDMGFMVHSGHSTHVEATVDVFE